jgi:hypothetical protein
MSGHSKFPTKKRINKKKVGVEIIKKKKNEKKKKKLFVKLQFCSTAALSCIFYFLLHFLLDFSDLLHLHFLFEDPDLAILCLFVFTFQYSTSMR